MSKINIMSLGGLNENGKNLYVVNIDGKIIWCRNRPPNMG